MSPSSTSGATGSAAALAPGERLDTLPPWPWDPLDPDAPRTLGFAAATFAEGRRDVGLIQPNGPRARKPFRFTSRQLRFLLWWYAVDPDGQWLYDHGVRRQAKGAGKSPFAAVVSLIEFTGPCRLDRFDDRVPGGCRARPMDLPLVHIAATAESQTANTMRMVRAFAPKRSQFCERYGLDPGKTIYYKVPEGTLEVITSSYTAAEGHEESFVVADETEHWKPANEGPTLAATLHDNLAKSGARLLETSNAWEPGQETVAEETFDAWVLQEEGRLQDEGVGRILYDAVLAPPDVDMSDYASLEQALRWVYDDCDWKRGADGEIDVRPIIRRIRSPKASIADSKRKYLNWPSAAEDAWLEVEQWTQLRADVEISDKHEVVLFFDGSKSRDATAIVGCRISDGHVFVPKVFDHHTIWEPDPAHDTEDTVPVAQVDTAVDLVFASYNVVGFFGDVAEWESFVKVSWAERHGARLTIWAAPNNTKDPQPIAWDMRSHTMEFTRAVELVENEILEGEFTHDGNPALSRHVGNARRRENRWGVSIGKESRSSAKKIDAAVCMIGARMVRRLYLAAEPKKKRTGVVV